MNLLEQARWNVLNSLQERQANALEALMQLQQKEAKQRRLESLRFRLAELAVLAAAAIAAVGAIVRPEYALPFPALMISVFLFLLTTVLSVILAFQGTRQTERFGHLDKMDWVNLGIFILGIIGAAVGVFLLLLPKPH